MPSAGICGIYLRHSVVSYTTELTPDEGGFYLGKLIMVSWSCTLTDSLNTRLMVITQFPGLDVTKHMLVFIVGLFPRFVLS